MSKLSKLAFQTKLLVGTIGVVAVAIIAMTLVTQIQVRSSLREMGDTSMESFGRGMFSLIEMKHALLSDKLSNDLDLVERAAFKLGNPFLYKENMAAVDVVDPVTGAERRASVPTLQFGGYVVNGSATYPERMKKDYGADTTIFLYGQGGLVSVASSVRGPGQMIPDGGPVFRALAKGEIHVGISPMGGKWMLAAYKPLKDIFGGELGAICVAREILTEDFRAAIGDPKIGGKGYGFIYNRESTLVLHPTLEGQPMNTYSFWEDFQKAESDFITYEFRDEPKQAFIKTFEPWGWTYVYAMTGNEIFNGVDRKLLFSNVTVAVFSLAAVFVVLLLLIKVVTKPLRQLSVFTGEVALGNFDAEIIYDAEDAIGDTIRSVHEMIMELKNKLGFSEGILRSLTYPCVVVDIEENITFLNQQELDLLQRDGKPEDYIGRKLAEFVYGDPDRETLLGRCLRDNCSIVGQESHGKGEKGREYDVLVDMAVLKDLDGEVIGAFTIITETTALKEKERQANEQRERIVEAAREADSISEQLSAAAEQLSAQVEQSSKGAGVQRERTAETATAMEQMNVTVLEVARNASDAAANADKASEQAGEGERLVGQVVEAIAQVEARSSELKESMDALGRQTENIGAIMQVIEDIADQTNLLALNAAIEAARAGDAGRGFAVVADEVRKLAEKTMDATKQVGQAIADIQQGASRNVEATEVAREAVHSSTELANRSGGAMEDIRGLVEQSADQVRNIATAAEEQSATSEEINRATEEINIISTETATAMQESQRAIQDLSQLALQLKELIRRMQQ